MECLWRQIHTSMKNPVCDTQPIFLIFSYLSIELSSKNPGVLESKWVTLKILFGSKEMKDKGFASKFLLNLLFSNFKTSLIRGNNTEDRTSACRWNNRNRVYPPAFNNGINNNNENNNGKGQNQWFSDIKQQAVWNCDP